MILEYNKNIEIELFDSLEYLSKKLLKILVPGNIALSGGSTYLQLLKEWSKFNINLDNIDFFPVDERVVDFNNSFSNWGNAYRIFLSKFNKNRSNHFTDATKYNSFLQNIDMDTVFLGVGDDGHTASLFTCESVFKYDLKAINTESPKEPKARVSLTGNYITKAKNIIIIFIGDGKKEILKKLLNNNELPITTLLRKVSKGTIYIHKPLIGDLNE